MYGYDGSTLLITYCMMPQSHQLSVNFRTWNSWGCQHGQMPSCSQQHLGLFNIFGVMCICSPGCPTSPATKNNCGATKLGHVDKPRVFDGGLHSSTALSNVNVIVHVMTISGDVIQVGRWWPTMKVTMGGDSFACRKCIFNLMWLGRECEWLESITLLGNMDPHTITMRCWEFSLNLNLSAQFFSSIFMLYTEGPQDRGLYDEWWLRSLQLTGSLTMIDIK